MLTTCICGGKKIISETTARISWPGQYDWKCDACGKEGIGWSFGQKPLVQNVDPEYFDTVDEAWDDYRSW